MKSLHYNYFEKLMYQFICIKGDEGGPLVADNGRLIGIISVGYGECGSFQFNINTNVFRYKDFIEEAMEK